MSDQVTLSEFNRLPQSIAIDKLLRCCGSQSWAKQMVSKRPFDRRAEVLTEAKHIWDTLDESDRIEAFGAHPEIGERTKGGYASVEQAMALVSPEATLERVRKLNALYRSKFGFVFLIFASGRSSSEILTVLEKRLENTKEAEMDNAGEEQLRITLLRLERMVKE